MPHRAPSSPSSVPGLTLASGLLVFALAPAGCSHGGAPDDLGVTPRRDGSLADLAMSSDDARFVPPDASPDAAPDLSARDMAGPTAAQCFEGWRMYGGTCPAPVITRAWATTTGCVGSNPGLFIEGMNFQLEMRNTGIANYGPQAQEGWNQKHWNELTTTRLCVTMSVLTARTFPGKPLSVKNPDGKVSNSVTIQSR